MGKVNDLTNKRFGKLEVIEFNGLGSGNRAMWLCKCDCGKTKVIVGNSLTAGHTKSCGCINSERLIKQNTTHNMRDSKLYNSWRGLKERCYNIKNKEFKNYGIRGIKVCNEWVKSFSNFMGWALTNGYKDGLSIDRKDVDGNYEPSNCKWSTPMEQSRNKRNNHFLTFNGETKIFKDWAKTVGITQSTLRDRFNNGWSVERALSTPKMARRVY